MTAKAYYNEIDPYAAEWLRNLIAAGEIAPGDVDTRSIEDVLPDDLRSYTQCHFFAGLGLWSHALRRAGWDDERPIWTGSCPCQPFSSAGKGVGFGDERHLWPAFFHLIAQCEPEAICGEQVASKDGYAWLDLVQTDMEGLAYAFWPVVLPVASVGGPHERHRIWWVGLADSNDVTTRTHGRNLGERQSASSRQIRQNDASDVSERYPAIVQGLADSGDERCGEQRPPYHESTRVARGNDTIGRQPPISMGDAERPRLERHAGHGGGTDGREAPERSVTAASVPFGLADVSSGRLGIGGHQSNEGDGRHGDGGSALEPMDHQRRTGPLNGFWRDADWLFCTDGKWRPVESGTRPLAHGLPLGMGTVGAGLRGLCDMAGVDADSLKRAKRYRVGTLRGYGNAICPDAAVAFIESWK